MASPRIPRNTTKRNRIRAALRRQGSACHACGLPIDYSLPSTDPMSFHADHDVPLARGGADTLENSRAMHKACNLAKGTKTYAPIVRRSGALD